MSNAIRAIKLLVPTIPLLISTIVKHYLIGPPQPSWDLQFHVICVLVKSFIIGSNYTTIEELQATSFRPAPTLAGTIVNESKISNEYRYEAQVHLDKILKPYEHVLDTEWKDLKDDGIPAEWVQVSNDGWEKREIRKAILFLHGGAYCMCSKASHRKITCKLAKRTNLRVFAIDYRLAPQNQFPAGLQDALSAYLYLLNPPKDAGFEPLSPKNIVIVGDSAGGGLGIALGLAIRDSGLPSCAGIICWSPRVDFTMSMPSTFNNNHDYQPYPGSALLAFCHKDSPVKINFKEKATALSERIKKQNLGPKIWHDSFDRSDGRIHLYASNESLAIPYVSPMVAESLCDLPPLLLVAGGEERLRDEIVYFAYRAAEPTKYKGPAYNEGKFEKSPFQTPTNTTLEVYEELPHEFQMFDHANTEVSYQRSTEFINRVLDNPNEPLPPSSFYLINGKGEIRPLENDHYKEVLNWKNIGIMPNIKRPATKSTLRRLAPVLITCAVLLLSVSIKYYM